MPHAAKELYEFSRYRLDVAERVLTRNGKRVALADKAFDTLCVLVRNQGRLVGKDELMNAVWPDSVVEENNLDQKISALRRVLGEKGLDKEKFIETVRGHGYRFLPEVRKVERNAPAAEAAISSGRVPPPASMVVPDVTGPDEATKTLRKRCSKCGRFYADETLVFCLEDGFLLSQASADSATAILPSDVTTDELPSGTYGSTGSRSFPPVTSARNALATGYFFIAGVALLAVLGVAGYIYVGRGGDTRIESVAVLPFVNTGNDPDAEYLSDGISEALINNLTELRQLRVVARTTAFRYKGKDIDPRDIGRELNVRAVLTGRVSLTSERLDVQVDLVDVATGSQLWGESFHRRVSDVLAVKQAIAHEAAKRLRLELTGEEQRNLDQPDTTSAEAYQYYLRGRHFWNKRNENDIKKAMEQFQRAVELDPNYALGHVGLADSHVFLHEFGSTSASESLPKARAAVDRALQIDDTLAEAYASSALINRLEWRWTEAEADFKRAIALNPNYAPAHIWLSVHYRNQRQFDEAMKEIRRAEELDPLSTVVGVNVAYLHILKNDPDSAIEQCRTVLELDPDSTVAHELIGAAHLKQGRFGEAVAAMEKAVDLSKRKNSRFLSGLGHAYAVFGRRTEALAVLNEIRQRYDEGEANGQNLAAVYAGLGDKERAFALLERDFAERRILLPEITWRYAFDGVRNDSRYADLVRRMGLQP